MRSQGGQALVEWAVVSFVLLIFALGILALGQIVGEYMAVRSASSQGAFAAARAPSQTAAQTQAVQAALEAVSDAHVQDFTVSIDSHGFQRGGVVTVTTSGYVGLSQYPIVSQLLGQRFRLSWQSSAVIEPYRSRSQ
ncbi:MAG: TadE/TadG family type IV pilus assembly protein [Candidatus Dormibacteria bacterium]